MFVCSLVHFKKMYFVAFFLKKGHIPSNLTFCLLLLFGSYKICGNMLFYCDFLLAKFSQDNNITNKIFKSVFNVAILRAKASLRLCKLKNAFDLWFL